MMQLSNSLTKIVRLYACTSFIVRIIMMDQEFDKVEDACNMVKINTTAAHEHIGKIERFICTIKERSRALVSDIPYTPLPCQVVIHLVYFAVLWLNSLPAAAGVSDKYSPWEIVLGRELDFKKTSKPPSAPTSKPTTIRPSQIQCAPERSREYSLA